MDISQLAAALEQLESGTSLTITTQQAKDQLSADLAGLIADALGGTLALTGIGQPQVGTATVTYTGTMAFLDASLPATATFWLTTGASPGTAELTLGLALPASWGFGTTYPSLADTTVGQLAFDSAAWVLESGTSDGSGLYSGLAKGLNFTGTVNPAGSPPLKAVGWLLRGTPRLVGALTAWSDQTQAPMMSLTSDFADSSFSLGPVTLATGLSASVSQVSPLGLPAAWTTSEPTSIRVVEVAVRGRLQAGTGADPLTLTMTMPVVEDPPLLTLSLDASQALNSLAQLAGIAGNTALSNLIPTEYPLTRLLRLDEFTIVVAPNTRQLVSLSIGVTLLPSQPALTAADPLVIPGEIVPADAAVPGPEPAIEAARSPIDEPVPTASWSTRLVRYPQPVLASAPGGDNPPHPVTWLIIPPDLLAISDVTVRFTINDPLHPSRSGIVAQIGGTFWLGDTYPIALGVQLPDVSITAYLLPGYTVDLVALLRNYGFTAPPGFELEIVELAMAANPSYKTFDLSVEIAGNVDLISLNDGKLNLSLTGIGANLSRSQVGYSVQLYGSANFAQVVDFQLLAAKQADGAAGWTFAGAITHPFSVGDLIGNVTGWTTVPEFLTTMKVTTVDVSYQTGTKEFGLDAGLSWLFADAGLQIVIGFKLSSTAAVEGKGQQYQGELSGAFTFLGMELELGYAFDQAAHTNTYTIRFGELTVSYANPNTQGERVLLINFGNITLGKILAYLIKLADPAASSSLSSPWNALDAINLSNLSVEVNFTQKYVEVDYALKLNLGFISIDSVGLRYYRDYGSGRVQVLLQGDFLGQSYGKDNPLGWNAVGGQPPALPGAGSKLLELRYVGIGQHVTMDVTGLTTVKAVIDAMTKTVVPLSNTSKNPLEQVGGLRFDSAANWLFGASFTLLKTFTINAVFLDPVVYGLRIDVAGPEADIFQGLGFEILYRKVTDTVGVYHLELKLPDAMRTLEFGQVSVTLPVVILDIYTNGNFRIDFGFPPSLQDWSQSFSVEVFPFVGYGGFYFAVLNGDTSTRLPKIDNGRFDPDIEFGFALSLGVGKSISMGPLQAGISVTVVGMLQGALAWFHPDDASTPKGLYYWIQGTIGIVGHVYGTVNFVVIKATVELTVYASATLTVEAYQPIVIALKAGVTVKASLTILFITLHFSFHAEINLTFTIGSASTPPWHVIGPNQARAARMRAQLGLHRPAPALAGRRAPAAVTPLGRRAGIASGAAAARPRAAATTTITLWLTPVISQALPTDFPDAPPAASGSPLVTANFLLFIENAIPPDATDARTVLEQVEDPAGQPFNQLMGQLLAWAVQDLGRYGGQVTADDLAQLHDRLDDPVQFAQWFSYASVTGFLADQGIVFQIRPRPTDQTQAASGSFFPMFPELALTLGATSVSFWDTNPIDADYVLALDAYFQQLAVDYANAVESDPDGVGSVDRPTRLLATDDASPTSMAGWLFGAYFGMLTKAVVQNAIDLLHAAPYQVSGSAGTSLDSIAASFATAPAEYVVRRGDTIASVDAMLRPFGARLAGALLAGDAADAHPAPGTRLDAELAVTAAGIVTANQDAQGLLAGTPLVLAELTYQVTPAQGQAGDSIDRVAQAFSFPGGQPLSALAVMTANADRADILLPGSSFELPTLTYTGRDGDTLDNVAAYFGVEPSAVSQTGLTFTVTGAKHTVAGGFVVHYTWKQGDTLDDVIEAFFAPPPADLPVFESLFARWNATIDFANPIAPGTPIQFPLSETLDELARYYFPTTPDAARLAALQPAISPAPVLAPLAALTIPEVGYPPEAGDTLASVARRFDLTLDELATLIGGATGILTEGAVLSVPDVPAMATADLIAAVQADSAINTAAASTSHFLLHGLRAPYPSIPQSPTYPLYSLTGQQLAVPGGTTGATLGYANGQQPRGWIGFAGGGASLDLPFTAAEQQQLDAFAGLALQPGIAALGRLPLYAYAPAAFTVRGPLHWQAAVLPPGCLAAGTSVPEPTIWSLPATLLERIADATGPALRYDLATASHRDSTTGLVVDPVSAYTWGTAVPLSLQQLTGPDGSPLTDGFGVEGTDDVGKQTLFELLGYLTAPGQTDTATVLLLYPPDPSGPNPKGAASDQLDTAATVVIKTNLSTLSASGPALRRDDQDAVAAAQAAGDAECVAGIDQPAAFLTLIWEASVVRGGGFYLSYANLSHTGLPGYLFGQGTTAEVTLLVLLQSQLDPTAAGLLPFNNVVVVGDGIDASDTDVFAQPTCHTVLPGDTLRLIGTADPPGLVQANQAIPGLLCPGRSLTLDDGTSYVIQPGDTFAGIVAAHPGTSLVGIAEASRALDSFTPGATMRFFGTGGRVVQAGDTLDSLTTQLAPTNISPAELALANQTVQGMLQPGATLALDDTTSYTVQVGDTLAGIYRAHAGTGVSIGSIAANSADLPVFTPGALVQPVGRGICLTVDQDTLVDAISRIGLPGLDAGLLGAANQDNLGLLRAGAQLTIGSGVTHRVQPGETLAGIARLYPPATPASIATASAGLPVLASGQFVYYGTDQLDLHASVPAGNTGFQLWRTDADGTDPDQNQLDDLFGLVGFGIDAGTYYARSNPGIPAGPQVPPGALPAPGADEPVTTDDTSYYRQAVSIHQSALPAYNAVPACPALPPPDGNPYAGIFADAATATYSTVQLSLALQDPSGNLTAGSALGLDPIRVGYTDRLIGVSQWPSLTTSFDVVAGRPELSIATAFHAGRYLPGAGQSYRTSHDSARTHLARYATVYYQLQEPGLLQCAVTSSIGGVDGSAEVRQELQLGLLGLVEQILAFLNAAQNLAPVYPPVAAGTTLGAFAGAYAVGVGDVLAANDGVELAGQLLAAGAPLAIPTYFVITAGLTVTGLLGQVSVAQLSDPVNLALPLEAGTRLTVPAQHASIPADSAEALNQLADANATTVADLAAANPAVPLNAAGAAMTFALGGQRLPVGAADTLITLSDAFNRLDPGLAATPAYVAVANQTVDGVFAGQSITWTGYVLRPGDTLGGVVERFGDPAQLLTANATVADVFPAGTAIYRSGQDTSYPVQPGDTFATVAAVHGVSLDALAARNGGLELLAVNQSGADEYLAVPDLVTLTPGRACYAGYPARGGTESIADVIAAFPGWDASGFLGLNAALPGLFAPDPLPGTELTPRLTDSLNGLAATLGVTPEGFVATYGDQRGILRAGATLMTPAPGTGAGTTIADAAARFSGLTPQGLATANAALGGLLAPQRFTLSYTPDQGPAEEHSYTTGPNDTFLTVTAAFNALFGVQSLGVADIVTQNPGALLAAGQTLLVPPAPAALPTLAITLPEAYSDPIFPLTLDLELLRDPNRVDPDLLADRAVFTDVTPILPSPEAADPTESLTVFAQRFEAAFPGLRLGTGEEPDSAPTTPARSKLWVVDCEPARGGVGYRIDAPGRGGFFALRPLSTQPWTQADVLVPTYTPGKPLGWATDKTVTAANLDAWLADLAAAVDQLLSPDSALAAGRLGPDAQALLGDVLAAKSAIADGLAGLVDHLLDDSSGDRDAAAEALRQQALTSLSSVYDTTVLVQLPVSVSSPYADAATAPALSGKPVTRATGAADAVTTVRHALADRDTFTSVATGLGITVIDLVDANTPVADVFLAGSTVALVIDGTLRSATAASGDTLGAVAGRLIGAAEPTPEQLADFAAALWDCDVTGGTGGASYVLNVAADPAIVLTCEQTLPVISFSTGKLSLVDGASSVTALVDVRDPELRRMAYLDLDFWFTQLEYDVRLPEPLAGSAVGADYRESSWLGFVLPIQAADLGQVQLPIPLRAYPGAPLLSAQSAAASDPKNPDLNKAKQWNYGFTLDYQAAAQDSIELGLFFNRLSDNPPAPPAVATAAEVDLTAVGTALAQFNEVAAAVLADLQLLLTDPADSRVLPALTAFRDLVTRVAAAWSAPAEVADADTDGDGEQHWYTLNPLVDQQAPGSFSYLELTADGADPLWPAIDGAAPTLRVGDQALYPFSQSIDDPLHLTLALDDLDAIGYQNGWSGVSISRNLGLLGSSEKTAATNPRFVYRTPLSLFSSKITPALLIDTPAPLSNSAAATMVQALAGFFSALFDLPSPARTFQIRVVARYGFVLAPGGAAGAIAPSIPLILVPLYAFDTATDADPDLAESFVSRLAAAVAQAATSTGAASTPGTYLFDIGVYSSLQASGATLPSKPLLDIRNRTYPGIPIGAP